jgi:hypothetical protein
LLVAMAKHIFESCHSAWKGTFVFLCLGLGRLVPDDFVDSFDLLPVFRSWTQLYYLLQVQEVFLEESKERKIDPPLIFCMDQEFTARCCAFLQNWHIFGAAQSFDWFRQKNYSMQQDFLTSLVPVGNEGKIQVRRFSSFGSRS